MRKRNRRPGVAIGIRRPSVDEGSVCILSRRMCAGYFGQQVVQLVVGHAPLAYVENRNVVVEFACQCLDERTFTGAWRSVEKVPASVQIRNPAWFCSL